LFLFPSISYNNDFGRIVSLILHESASKICIRKMKYKKQQARQPKRNTKNGAAGEKEEYGK
jgi:hypothetical protein